ncbi:MAG: enoyl-CoA hydratase/isomerase family protein [Sporichthyaceae bacterium]|nr:enoyl-CoA hydratase/isomerase family protein [Sporichthyaceae bacterium]
MTDVVQYDLADAVATVTLNRPEAMNALDTALKTALRDTLRSAAEDPAVRAVVLTGSGRAFCVGQDLAQHAENLETDPAAVWSTVPEHYTPIAALLATMPKPVVAAVNGVAAGAGAAFCFACDFRIASAAAKFTMAFSAVGLSADSGSSWSLPRLVGTAKAKELLMLTPTLTATEALEIGLVTEVVAPDDVAGHTRALAVRLAAGPTVAYGAIRRAIAQSAGHDLAASLAFEHQMMELTGATEDHRSAVRSFLAKERPQFRGR